MNFTKVHRVYRCDFCPMPLKTSLERSEHILSHFEQKICGSCDQRMLCIGDYLYVLHTTITCIDKCKIERESDAFDHDNGSNSQLKYVDQHATVTCDERIVKTETMNHDQHEKIPQQTVILIDDDENKCVDVDIVVGRDHFELELGINAETNPLPEGDTLAHSHIQYETSSTNKTEAIDDCESQSGFQCNICLSVMTTKYGLESHILRKHNPAAEQLKCTECKMAFATNYELNKHNDKKPKMCDHCKQTFCSSSSLRAHRVECSSKLKKDQGETTQNNDQPREKRQYTKRDANEKPKCNICSKTFSTRGHLHTHRKRIHDKHTKNKCEKCERTFAYSLELDRHKENLIVCNKCGDSFCAKTLLISHQTEYCNLMNKDEIGDRQCKLERCNEIVAVNTWFNHMITKHNDIFKSFKCDICQKLFKAKISIYNHMLMIHCPNRRKFKCDLCEYKCVRKPMLKHHKKYTHSKERNFVCSQCGKRFKQKHQLSVHMNTHTGEKPFECLYCSKRFCDSSQRAEHIRMHTGEKKFACEVENCGQRFIYYSVLRRHKFSAHGIYHKKIPCSICNEIFPELVLLKRHMKKHETQL